jgi:hypothetical protein
MSAFTYRGIPRTPDEWTALARVASGHADVSRDALRSLFMLGLVERQLGRICLSEHGRTTFGATQQAHRLTGAPSGDHSQGR